MITRACRDASIVSHGERKVLYRLHAVATTPFMRCFLTCATQPRLFAARSFGSGTSVKAPSAPLFSLSGQQPDIAMLAAYSLLEIATSDDSPEKSMLLAFTRDATEIPAAVMSKLRATASSGTRLVLSAQHESDISDFNATLGIEIIGDDAILSEEGEKQRRIRLRPAYSFDSELA